MNYGLSNNLLATVEALRIPDLLELRAESEANVFIHKFPKKLNQRLQNLQTEISANALGFGLTILLKNQEQLWGALHLWHTETICLEEQDFLEFEAYSQMLEMALGKIEKTATSPVTNKTTQKELIALNSIISRIHNAPELDKILSEVLKETLDVLDLEAGSIYLINKNKGHAQLMTSEGIPFEFEKKIEQLQLKNPSVTAVLQADKSLVTLELAFQYYQSYFERNRNKASRIVTIPVRSRNSILGFINLLVPFWRTFDSDEIYFLDSISKQMGVSLENKYLTKKMAKIPMKNAQAAA